MRLYEFKYWTGPYENDISFRFHLKPNEKLNDITMNKVYFHFKSLIDEELSFRRAHLINMNLEDEEYASQFIKDEINQFQKILELVKNLCDKWQDFYDEEKESIVYKIDSFTAIYLNSETIMEF